MATLITFRTKDILIHNFVLSLVYNTKREYYSLIGISVDVEGQRAK